MMMAQLNAHQSLTLNAPDDYIKFEDKIQATNTTAIIALDDIFALRIIQLVELYGYRVPDDISVISFNNSIFSTLTHPYLTTLDIETEKLGQIAMHKLASLIKGDRIEGTRFVIPHKLIERETVITKARIKMMRAFHSLIVFTNVNSTTVCRNNIIPSPILIYK